MVKPKEYSEKEKTQLVDSFCLDPITTRSGVGYPSYIYDDIDEEESSFYEEKNGDRFDVVEYIGSLMKILESKCIR